MTAIATGTEEVTRGEPKPMPYMREGVTYYGASGNLPEQIDPHEIAYYVHCRSGLSPMEFIAWLAGQLDLLDAIDPMCEK